MFNSPVSQEEREKETESGYWMKTMMEYKDTVERVIDSMQLQHTSFLAGSKFNNFAYDPTVEASKQRNPSLELYDAGIDGNLPFPVLFRPEREVDIIIASNSSKYPDINRGRALRVGYWRVYKHCTKSSDITGSEGVGSESWHQISSD